jgi:hypothetical protein
MSVSILNITGNKCNFEDDVANDLANNLRQRIGSNNTMLTSARGNELMCLDNSTIDGHYIIIILAHGKSDQNRNITLLDTGLSCGLPNNLICQGRDMLNSFELFLSILPRNSIRYLFVFYVCNQVSVESIVSTDIPQCLGAILSWDSPNNLQIDPVADLVTDLHNIFDRNIACDSSIKEAIKNWENQQTNRPCFQYFPALHVYQQDCLEN